MLAQAPSLLLALAAFMPTEPRGRGGETDHLNENFILANDEPSGPSSVERIVDDEMHAWLKAADDKDIEVIFVADSCHSGTMTRGVGSKFVRYRTGTFADPDLADDLLKLPDAAGAGGLAATLRSLLSGQEFQAGVAGVHTRGSER
jgi:hypothetical protein